MPAVGGINGDRHCQRTADEMSLELERRRELDIISAHVGQSHEREKVTQGESVEEEGREPGMDRPKSLRGGAEQERGPGEQSERLKSGGTRAPKIKGSGNGGSHEVMVKSTNSADGLKVAKSVVRTNRYSTVGHWWPC